MNILVTGGSGTLGGYVLRELLRAGHQLTDYSRTPPAIDGVRFVAGDIMEPERLKEACGGQDAVIHLAAVPGPGRASPADLTSVNVIGTLHALEAAVAAGAGRLVLASSGAATGFSFQRGDKKPRYLPLDEEHPCEPQDEYGLSKLLAELACKRYTDAYGIGTACLRINNNWYLDRGEAEAVIGRGWARRFGTVEELWLQRYRKTIEDPEGEWPTPGPPAPHKILWAFTDARDAAQAFRLAVEDTRRTHEVFLINGDDTCSTTESRALVERYYPGTSLHAPLEGHASLWSHARATRLLGYRPRYTWRESDFARWLAGQEDAGTRAGCV
jgi:nucleoside-diphosphate-sugar epimerase